MGASDDGIDGPRGQELWQRADAVLPGGAVYATRSADFAGRGVLPGFIHRAEGCRITDVDGRSYIDLLGANGPNLLGYGHPEVEAAAAAQAADSRSASFFPATLVELVEALLEWQSAMGWGLLAKNGSETLALAVRIARQHAGRSELIAFEAAYHGADGELAARPPRGPLTALTRSVHRLPWNDAQALRDFAAANRDRLAGILLNPLDQSPRRPTQSADPEFVAAIAEVRETCGACLVLDDVRHGFRLHPQGSQHLLGLEPDLLCLGKALGNGHAISALLGREELRAAARRILFTATYVFEAPPMRAALAVLEIYRREDVFARITAAGQRLRQGLDDAAALAGVGIAQSGPVTMPTLLFEDDPEGMRLARFARRAAELGAIFHPALNWNLSLAHGPDEIDEAVAIAAQALRDTA